MSTLVIDGHPVTWAAYGDPEGAPILWCHGGLSSRLDAALAHPAAAAVGALLISIDRPGIGGSTLVAHAPVIDWAPVAGAVMDQLGHDRFAVAGWSAGGPFALACARVLGPRVTATATLGGGYPVTDPARRRELGLLLDRVLLRVVRTRPRLATSLIRVAASPPDWVLRQLLLQAVRPAERRALKALPRADATGMLREAVRQGPAGVAADYWSLAGEWGFPLEAVTAPVTVWQGDADGVLPPSHGIRLARELGNAELRICTGAGHFLALTHGREIFGELVASLRPR